jgi:membrane associated rhomboid family serine protease
MAMARNPILKDLAAAFNKPNQGHIQLIIVNLLVFVFIGLTDLALLFNKNVDPSGMITSWLAMPANPLKLLFKPWTIVSYMFVHAGFWHILWNMLFLFWFGRIFIDFLGTRKLVGLYFLGGFGGAILYLLSYNLLPGLVGASIDSTMVGASAAVMAIIFAIATKVPDYTIRLLLLGDVKLRYVAIFLFLMDLIALPHGNSGGHLAHIGGALIGMLYVVQLNKGQDLVSGINKVLDWFAEVFNPKPKMKVSHSQKKAKPMAAANIPDSAVSSTKTTNQADIDRILDKIAEKGYNSLSKTEKQTLFRASNNE